MDSPKRNPEILKEITIIYCFLLFFLGNVKVKVIITL